MDEPVSVCHRSEGDVIYIDGIQWELLGKPVYADSTLSRTQKVALPVARVLHQW